MSMNKTELIAAMAERSGLSRQDSQNALDAFISVVGDVLGSGGKVKLLGFGAFEVKSRAARIGRNPRTNEAVDIPATRQPVFRAGKVLKKVVF